MKTTCKTCSLKKSEWIPELSLNDDKIDSQHKQFFDIVNNLIDHVNTDRQYEITNETIYKLLLYIDEHFEEEEKFLESINYPKLEEHKNIHHKFTKQIAMFSKEVFKNKKDITKELLNYLLEWVNTHIRDEDLDYKSYLD